MATLKVFESCEPLAPPCIVQIISGGLLPKCGDLWRLGNEIKPADLYCYLYARFGPPNGLQNLFRKNGSGNLIHWDWTLGHKNGIVMVLGLNLRTEIHLLGDWKSSGFTREAFITEVKSDFASQGKEMARIRKEILEDWEMFVNPYKNLRESILRLKEDLDSLQLNPLKEELENPASIDDYQRFNEEFFDLIRRYDRGIGLAMALRMMIPVLAETFLNLLFFILCRPDVRQNPRLYDSAVRANIDVKAQSFHLNCLGFKSPVDWSSKPCAAYNSIVNERNDLLHGNVLIEKLKFDEVFFNGTVPVFKQYRTLWQQSVGVSVEASGLDKVKTDLEAVDGFIEYVLGCLHSNVREELEVFMAKRDLGRNKKNNGLGILLPDYLVDFGLGPAPEASPNDSESS